MHRLVAYTSFLSCAVAFQLASLQSAQAADPKSSAATKTAILAGGCFWCTETDFEHCPGVTDVVSGYSGGTTENPNYSTYHDGHHTECSLITYDPKKVTYAGLVEWLVKHINPTDADGQFADRGDGYKPIVFYENDEEKKAAQGVFDAIDAKKVFNDPIQIELRERSEFWPAEAGHQDFHKTNAAHYREYRSASGRTAFIKKYWGKKADILELPQSTPKGAISKGVIEDDK